MPKVFISGYVNTQTQLIPKLARCLQNMAYCSPSIPYFPIPISHSQNISLTKENNLQAAMCIGKILFKKSDPKYPYLQVFNTLLGGYFGSRLMRNIREHKGYTYHIGSRIMALKHTSYLCISTYASKNFAQEVCQEIAKEIHQLQTQDISLSELSDLKNYMLGQLLFSLDDVFTQMPEFKQVVLYDLDQNFYMQLHQAITSIQPETIRHIAQEHFQQNSLTQVIIS